MFRPLALLLTLGALAPAAALAAPSRDEAPRPPRAAGWQVAQDGDYDIFYDHYGRRILLDRETGEVVAVEPGEPRISREERRREQRRRALQRDDDYGDGLYGDDSGGTYVRRLPDPLEEAEPYPDTGGDVIVRRPERLPRPDEPGGEYLTPGEPDFSDDQVARDAPVERQPLDDVPAVDPDDAPALVPAAPQVPGVASAEPGVDGERTASTPASDAPKLEPDPPMPTGVREEVAALQVLLDRGGASPGVIDGRFGSNVDKALVAYNQINGTGIRSTDAEAIKAALAASGGDAFTTYTISAEDAAGPFVASLPSDYGEKAKLERLGYASVTEMLAERFHMDEAYLKSINEGVSFNRPGSVIRVAQTGVPKVGEVVRVTADKAAKQVHGYGADGRLLVSYPATIGSPDTPSPSGVHAVARIAFDPEYTYNPKINFQQGANDKVLRIPPGPNGPVGSIWIALDKPTYGVHGTPEPSRIGKAESHGCVRLTNWDAAELAKMVKPGVPVEFVE